MKYNNLMYNGSYILLSEPCPLFSISSLASQGLTTTISSLDRPEGFIMGTSDASSAHLLPGLASTPRTLLKLKCPVLSEIMVCLNHNFYSLMTFCFPLNKNQTLYSVL